ncbi:acetyl-CoA decarbonylase/synthase epsilon subunit, partial [Candidatus Gastranaerophilus sp. (ex Termes propinquus)]
TLIGLSNVSHGAPAQNRALINRVFLVLAMGAGLDAVIVDSFDSDTVGVCNMLKAQKALSGLDDLYINLYNMANSLGELEDVKYDSGDKEQSAVYKTAQILLNKEIYSHSYIG